ncbi:helix-turn-helix domain-containing protein [Actinokineospora sp. NBRC 105648]|uniref:helix-turn-helix domain-containing protein n=1 Tax=Actinokineospora sp. NBRC 105648 TaxID=3032206 RepID=UPI0024A0B521|nr:helix-turn-helix domain-containing protein [Actinokineospora sp. NBRC 105648]GLZ39560.1 AraC family transcriptional regulator [Actinokineospora sp. NBRC 105648]
MAYRGVLDEQAGLTRFRLRTVAPSAELAPFVEYHWIVSWDLDEPYEQRVVPHPNVHLVFEPEGARVYGVLRGLFTRRLVGRAQVLGVRFHPGGFRPWLGGRVADLTDRTVPVAEFFDVEGSEKPVGDAATDAEMVAAAESVLLPRLPEPDPVVEQVRSLVALIAEAEVTRVDELATAAGLTVRSLQRLFSDYVGVGPKWVIQRHRMHSAAARAADGAEVDWAALAAELGYSDQAHFTRDFTATIGVSPGRYAAG